MKRVFPYLLLSIVVSSKAQTKRDTERGSDGYISGRASFPGGEKGWVLYLSENFKASEIRCLLAPRDTTYRQTAAIQFKIDKEGIITDVECRNSNFINSILRQEAMRLITQSPKWLPAMQKWKACKRVQNTGDFNYSFSLILLI